MRLQSFLPGRTDLFIYYYYEIIHEVHCKQKDKTKETTELQTIQTRKNACVGNKKTNYQHSKTINLPSTQC